MKIQFPCSMTMSKKWVRAFFISHIAGWTMATLQTLWIVWEIRRIVKKL